jgi:hypothetical protein
MSQQQTGAGADNRPPPSSSPIPKASLSMAIPANLAGNKKAPRRIRTRGPVPLRGTTLVQPAAVTDHPYGSLLRGNGRLPDPLNCPRRADRRTNSQATFDPGTPAGLAAGGARSLKGAERIYSSCSTSGLCSYALIIRLRPAPCQSALRRSAGALSVRARADLVHYTSRHPSVVTLSEAKSLVSFGTRRDASLRSA